MTEIKQNPSASMQDIVSLCKRRGFISPSSEIYGGINSCWDYGPFGIELKRNIKELWWTAMTRREDIEGIDASILMHPRVWEASGHVENFTDPLVDCKKCKQRFREDQIDLSIGRLCPKCGGELTASRLFNLMFKTHMGAMDDSSSIVYLRPETAQGIYVNFQNVQITSRQRIPFGIAQIGKAFRNEITPGNFIFRTREFEQMEMQYFVHEKDSDRWFDYWKEERLKWFLKLGIQRNKLQYHEHGHGELAHYAKKAFDIQYLFPFGWQEIEGIHNRSDYDLKRHQEFSGKNLQYTDLETNEKYIPYIIETSVGCDRTLLVCLLDAYVEEAERVVLRFDKKIAPVKVAFFPLSKKDDQISCAKKLRHSVQSKMMTLYDESGSIGKRYRRQDEIGTPYCITIDFESMTDQKVTVRERDTMTQERISMDSVATYLSEKLASERI